MQNTLGHKSTKCMLTSTFNDRPAPGGIFEAPTRTYRKQLPSRAFYWPLRAYPIDQPIVRQLKDLHCKTMILEVIDSDGLSDSYVVDFETFLRHSVLIDWPARGDHRFPVRRYLPIQYWQKCKKRCTNDQEEQADDMPDDISF